MRQPCAQCVQFPDEPDDCLSLLILASAMRLFRDRVPPFIFAEGGIAVENFCNFCFTRTEPRSSPQRGGTMMVGSYLL